ncbi:hypothetical protein [Aliarcobacter cryaerophilus]|uniref:hypothetical protein n=1 Tax=Aliarcobacter cryaerophilus TaxID=28198 RepID=UPI00082ABEB5|nr:hypothetical protein [Aliarcobacter cryaerophilus]
MLTEYELVQKVKPFFKEDYEIYEEVKIFTRSIDIVLKKGNEIISIEFKLSNWKKAFEQILDYQLVTDYSYLCIPKKNLRESTLNILKERGIGLLSYDNQNGLLKELIKPSLSKEKVDFYREYLLTKIQKL